MKRTAGWMRLLPILAVAVLFGGCYTYFTTVQGYGAEPVEDGWVEWYENDVGYAQPGPAVTRYYLAVDPIPAPRHVRYDWWHDCWIEEPEFAFWMGGPELQIGWRLGWDGDAGWDFGIYPVYRHPMPWRFHDFRPWPGYGFAFWFPPAWNPCRWDHGYRPDPYYHPYRPGAMAWRPRWHEPDWRWAREPAYEDRRREEVRRRDFDRRDEQKAGRRRVAENDRAGWRTEDGRRGGRTGDDPNPGERMRTNAAGGIDTPAARRARREAPVTERPAQERAGNPAQENTRPQAWTFGQGEARTGGIPRRVERNVNGAPERIRTETGNPVQAERNEPAVPAGRNEGRRTERREADRGGFEIRAELDRETDVPAAEDNQARRVRTGQRNVPGGEADDRARFGADHGAAETLRREAEARREAETGRMAERENTVRRETEARREMAARHEAAAREEAENRRQIETRARHEAEARLADQARQRELGNRRENGFRRQAEAQAGREAAARREMEARRENTARVEAGNRRQAEAQVRHEAEGRREARARQDDGMRRNQENRADREVRAAAKPDRDTGGDRDRNADGGHFPRRRR